MRAVLDANVLVSALISPRGAPAKIVEAWEEGAFEIVVSEQLLTEVRRVFSYPRVSEFVLEEDADGLVALLRTQAVVAHDVRPSPFQSVDPDDDYLIALAAAARVPLVSGDHHLLDLSERLPVLTPRQFLDVLDSHSP